MSSAPLENLCKKLGYEFTDSSLLTLALTHRSKQKNKNLTSNSNTQDVLAMSYERLEFLGDAVLGLCMAKHLYTAYPHKQEGQLTRMRATLVREETLVQVAKQFGLGAYLILGAGEVKAGGRKRDSILADVVEAILGAIYVDCDDIKLIQGLISTWFASQLQDIENISSTAKLKDNKSQLQELLQSQKLPLPSYSLVKVSGKAPKEVFTVKCETFDNKENRTNLACAEGKSRRIAEQNAAKIILDKLQS